MDAFGNAHRHANHDNKYIEDTFYKWDNLTIKDIREFGETGILKFTIAYFLLIFGTFYGFLRKKHLDELKGFKINHD